MAKLIDILLLLYFGLFPFGQLTKIPLGIPEINLYLTDIIVGILGGLGILGIMRGKRPRPPLFKPMSLFLLIAGFSLAVNISRFQPREIIISSLYLVRLIAYFGFYLTAYRFRKKIIFKNCLIVAGLAAAIFGLIQYFMMPNMTPLTIFEWDPHYYRLVGTFLDPGFTGIILVLTLILLITSQLNAIGYWLLAIGYLSLALTYSRASYLAFLASMTVLSLRRKSLRLLGTIIIIMVITIIILPRKSGGEGIRLERTTSVQARIGNWQQAWSIFRKYPLIGVGFNTYRYAQKNAGLLDEKWQVSHSGAGADSSLLFVLATTGMLGVFGMLGLLGKIWQISRGKSTVVLASMSAVLVHSFFLNSLFYPWVLGWLMVILAED